MTAADTGAIAFAGKVDTLSRRSDVAKLTRKIDFILRKNRDFSREEFARR